MNFFRRHFKKLLVAVAILALYYTVQATGLVRWYSASVNGTLVGTMQLSQIMVDSAMYAGRSGDMPVIALQDALQAGDGLFVVADTGWPWDTVFPGRVVVHMAGAPGSSGGPWPVWNSFSLYGTMMASAECMIASPDGRVVAFTFSSSVSANGSASTTGIVNGHAIDDILAGSSREAQLAWLYTNFRTQLQQLAAEPSRFSQAYVTTGSLTKSLTAQRTGSGFGF